MVSVDEAEKIITQSSVLFPAGECSLLEVQGHILREDIYSDRDQPPFDRVTMDGIAIDFSDYQNGVTEFKIVGMQNAGIPALNLETGHTCIEVMTGAVLPNGCNCVIPYEKISIGENVATLTSDLPLKLNQNIHAQGSDNKKGDLVLKSGTPLCSPHIAILSSVGKSSILVDQKPKIAVIATGDELVGVEDAPESHQIRKSNTYALHAALKNMGHKHVNDFHVNDNKVELKECLANALAAHDVLVLTGGVSMGKYDFIPEVMGELGVDVLFHKVKQRPGKPFWFGVYQGSKLVFALPGNPVSAIICFHRYVIPYLRRASRAYNQKQEYAVLSEDFDFDKPFTYFLPVNIEYSKAGEIKAFPLTTHGSGDFGALAETDGFVELPADTNHFPKGYAAPLFRWR